MSTRVQPPSIPSPPSFQRAIALSRMRSTELAGGFPFCLANYLGQIWAGTHGLTSAASLGKLYRTLDTIAESWTLDHTAVASSGYFTSLCVYNGNLYAATTANDAYPVLHIVYGNLATVWAHTIAVIIGGAMWLCGLASITSMGRMWYAFARDDGMPGSRVLKQIHARYGTPVAATLVTSLCCAGKRERMRSTDSMRTTSSASRSM